MMVINKLIPFICIILFIQCNKEKTPACGCYTRMCTEEYRLMTVTVKDKNNNAVNLDDYYTILTSTRDTFKIDAFDPYYDSLNHLYGTYPILSDSELGITENCVEDFEFVGLKNNIAIARKTYKIQINCCHVEWAEKYSDIVVD